MSKIIDKFIAGSLSSEQIGFTTHYHKRIMEREINRDYIKNLILNEDYVDFYEDLKQKGDFKIIYPSENSGYQIVVVVTTNSTNLVVKTAYEQKIR